MDPNSMDIEIIIPAPSALPSHLSRQVSQLEHKTTAPEESSNMDEDHGDHNEVRNDPGAGPLDAQGGMTSLMTSHLKRPVSPPEYQTTTPPQSSNNDKGPADYKEVSNDPVAGPLDAPLRMTSLMTFNIAGHGEATSPTSTEKLQGVSSTEVSSTDRQELSYRMAGMTEMHGDKSGQSAGERQPEDSKTETEIVLFPKDEAAQDHSATPEKAQSDNSRYHKTGEQEQTGETLNGKTVTTHNHTETVMELRTLSQHLNTTAETSSQLTKEDQDHEEKLANEDHHPEHNHDEDEQPPEQNTSKEQPPEQNTSKEQPLQDDPSKEEPAEHIPSNDQPTDHNPSKEDQPPAENPSTDDHPLPHKSSKDDQPLPNNSSKDDQPLPNNSSKDDQPLPHNSSKDDQPPTHNPNKDDQPLPNNSSKDDKPPTHNPNKDDQPLPHNSSKDDQPLPNNSSKDDQPLPHNSSKDDQPLPNNSSKDDQPPTHNPNKDDQLAEHSPSKDDQLSDTEEKPSDLAVYTRRWYILAVFSLLAFTQAAVWNTFGPISTTSEEALGWMDATIAMLSNWGPVPYVLFCVFFSWLLDVKGVRPACLLSSFLVLLGTSLRCITMETPAVTWLMHIGHFLNGAGGPLSMGGAPAVSAAWFPVEERATATAIGTCSDVMGVAIAFLLGPSLVHSHRTLVPNTTDIDRQEEGMTGTVPDIFSNSTTTWIGANNSSVAVNTSEPLYEPDIARERHEIQIYMFISAGWSAVIFILIVVYFPNKPPKPPCATAGIQREDFLKGLKQLMRRKYFWLVALLYGIPFGVWGGWTSLLNLVLSDHGISEKEAGWIGFYATVTGCLLSVVVARFADIFKRVMKQFIIALYVACAVCFLLFTLATINVIPPSIALFYVTIIGGVTSLNAAIPLIYELACELAYPTGEGTTNVVLTTLANLFGLIFVFIMLVPNIGSMWMNWTLSATVAACVPLWLLLGADYNCCSMWMNWTMTATVAACVPLWLLLRADYNRLTVDEAIPTLDAINTEVVVVVHPDEDTSVAEAAKSIN